MELTRRRFLQGTGAGLLALSLTRLSYLIGATVLDVDVVRA